MKVKCSVRFCGPYDFCVSKSIRLPAMPFPGLHICIDKGWLDDEVVEKVFMEDGSDDVEVSLKTIDYCDISPGKSVLEPYLESGFKVSAFSESRAPDWAKSVFDEYPGSVEAPQEEVVS